VKTSEWWTSYVQLRGEERSQLTLLMIVSCYVDLPKWLLESVSPQIICVIVRIARKCY